MARCLVVLAAVLLLAGSALGAPALQARTTTSSCSPNPCLNGGTCSASGTSYTCTCPSGCSGSRCESITNNCSPNPCKNGGSCTNAIGSYTCTCPTGYSGATCTTVIPTTAAPTTAKPTTATPTTAKPTTATPTTAKPTTATPTTAKPTTATPTTAKPTTAAPTTAKPTTATPTSAKPTTATPTTSIPAGDCNPNPCNNNGQCTDTGLSNDGVFTCGCTPAFGGPTCTSNLCSSAQAAMAGVCGVCPVGEVQSPDGTQCVYCPAGTVRFPTDAVTVATCAPSSTVCGTAQAPYFGICVSCSPGMVQSCDGTTCAFCAAGTVKSPNTADAVDATCVPGLRVCGTAQAPINGQCVNCPLGQVRSADGTTCTYCPAGTAKIPSSDTVADAVCVAGADVCGTPEAPVDGKCQACPYGMVRSPAGDICAYCPAGTAKVPQSFTVSVAACVSGLNACGTAQAPVNGMCIDCPLGQIKSCDGTVCQFCRAGTVKIPNSYAVDTAVCVPGLSVCGTAQVPLNGQCAPCPLGAVQSPDGTNCYYCPPGSVKVPFSDTAVTATCQKAATACGTNEVSWNGICGPEGRSRRSRQGTCGSLLY